MNAKLEEIETSNIAFKFSTSNFMTDIISKMALDGLTRYAAAKQIGIPITTFVRVLKSNKNHQLGTYVLICNWLGASVYKYFKLQPIKE